VHFPTDLNLPWDSIRKCLGMVEKPQKIAPVKGWRKIKNQRKTLKSLLRATSRQVFKGKNEQRKKQLARQYLQQARALEARCAKLVAHPPAMHGNAQQILALVTVLEKYNKYITKFTDQIKRRLLEGEVIPADEKIYSIFEEDT